MTTTDTDASTQDARLFDLATVSELLSVGRDVVFGLTNSGALGSVRIGRRRLVSARQLANYISSLEAVGADDAAEVGDRVDGRSDCQGAQLP